MGDAVKPPIPSLFLGEDGFLDEGRRHRRTRAMIFGIGEIAVPAPAP
jgi:hypothetical protein